MISPLPGRHHAEAGQRDVPAPRHRRRGRRRRRRRRSAIPGGGYLVLTRPWPSMLRGIWGDPERYRETYWSRFDGPLLRRRRRQARRRRLLLAARPRRRRDDRRRATASRPPRSSTRSSATPRSPRPRSSARKDDTTGQAIIAFVILRARQRAERRARRRAARPRRPTRSARSPSRRRSCSPRTCPKTRSGKIMRRLLRDVAEDQALGDTTTLADPRVVEGIKARYLADRHRRGLSDASVATPSARPEHWTWRDGPVEPGPAVVVDIDGVLSDAASRQHYLEAPRRDWDAFFEACGDDPVIEEVQGAPRPARPDAARSCCSPPGPSGCTTSPRRGCAATSIRWDLLIMRAVGRLRAGPRLQAGDGVGPARLRLRPAPRLRGRPPQRRDVPLRGHPLHLLPLGYYD